MRVRAQEMVRVPIKWNRERFHLIGNALLRAPRLQGIFRPADSSRTGYALALALLAFAGPAFAQTMEFACPGAGTPFTFDSGVNIVARGQDGMDCAMDVVGGKPFKVRGLLIANPSPDGSDTSSFIAALRPQRLCPLKVGNKIEPTARAGAPP